MYYYFDLDGGHRVRFNRSLKFKYRIAYSSPKSKENIDRFLKDSLNKTKRLHIKQLCNYTLQFKRRRKRKKDLDSLFN